MAARFRSGLVVGKFAPLHLGHEHLIRHAQGHCEQLYLLSWSRPELPGYEAERRARWLALRFPTLKHWVLTPERVAQWQRAGLDLPDLPYNHEDDETQREFVARFCQQVLGDPVEAVFTSEAYGDGFAAHLAQRFGQPVRHLGLDPQRSQVAISGSRLRADIHGLRSFLAPAVYGDFVERIGLLGGESTGKSSLAQALAGALDTRYAAEFGREHWLACDGQLGYDDLLHIGRTQVAREDQLAGQARRYLVCDTTPLTTLFYCQDQFGRAEAELEQLARRLYHHLFLCADDFPFVQDGTRQGEAFRRRQNRWYLEQLQQRGWRYSLLTGSLAQRVNQVLAALEVPSTR
ncbi:AAA family ATPase [Pseudomonas borbori]